MSGQFSNNINLVMRNLIDSIIYEGYSIMGEQPFTDAQGSAPRPEGEYCSVVITSVVAVGEEESRLNDNVDGVSVNFCLANYYEFLYSLNFYRTNSLFNANAVKIGLARQSSLDYLNSIKYGLGSRSEIRNISERTSRGWEQRMQMDVGLNTAFLDKEILDTIQILTVSGELQTFGGGTPIETEANIL